MRPTPPPLCLDKYENDHKFGNALLHDSEYSEYVVFKVGTHMRMVRHSPTLLGQCPKFDRIFVLAASLSLYKYL